MTQTELDALPVMGAITYREAIIDGRNVRIPVMAPAFVLYDPVFVIGDDGKHWMVGSYKGIEYKSQVSRL